MSSYDQRASVSRAGFTMVEVLIAVMIGAILTTIAIDTFGPAQSRMAAGSARQTFTDLQARARAYAIERGVRTDFRVDFTGDSVWIEAGGDRVDGLDFGDARDIDLRAGVSALLLCMSPRGFADLACNSFGSPLNIDFVQGGASRSLTLQPIGQIQY